MSREWIVRLLVLVVAVAMLFALALQTDAPDPASAPHGSTPAALQPEHQQQARLTR